MKYSRLVGATAFALAAGLAPGLAADLPRVVPVKAPAMAPVFDWTGFYVGAYAGVGVNRSHGYDPELGAEGEVDYTGSGFTGGGTLGLNWQLGRHFVSGIEGDIGYLGLNRRTGEYNDVLVYNSRTAGIATLRGRLGITNGPTLNYVTGGGAWVKVEDSILDSVAGTSAASSKTKSGYAVGSGVETMLGGNWTAKAEYLFVDVGRGDLLNDGTFPLQTDKHRYHLMKFGVNYLFGGKPQPALPASDWSGFYAGIVGGTAVSGSRGIGPTPNLGAEIGNNGAGFTGGGQAGINWQFAPNWVAGVEGDFSFLGIDRTTDNYNDSPALLGINTRWLATARGRLGYSSGPALLYVTGGGAWVKVRDDWAFPAPVSSGKTLSGYSVGGGIETTIAGNWTTRTEYLYVDVGKGDTLVSAGSPIQVDHKFHLFRTALTYRFASGAANN